MPELRRRFSIRGPIALVVVVLVLIVTLTVLWNVTLVHDYQQLKELAVQESIAFHGTMIAIGSVLFISIIVLSCILAVQLVHNVRWAQRQSEFIASVSHELNSPLASIKLFAQTLRQDDIPPEVRADFVQKILIDVERLGHQVSNILRTAELDHGHEDPRLALELVELRSAIEPMVEHVLAVAGDRLAVTIESEGPIWVKIDDLAFRQVIDNLLENSVRYRGGERANVEITLRRQRDRAVITVNDDGVGLPPLEAEKIFDRFYRVESDIGRPKRGMGIGLHVVRSILAAHLGSVHAHSPGMGLGLTITMSLPLHAAPESGATT
ncbi:MAG: ATP-binding protein [Planctomycetota bacterium]